nr:MAG TPA: hypothetical protein [Caudoviricetes sp.]
MTEFTITTKIYSDIKERVRNTPSIEKLGAPKWQSRITVK